MRFLSTLILFFTAYIVVAQQQIEIKNADDLIFDNSSGINAKRLVGNVIMQHDNTLMYCDSAYLYDENNTLDAYGSVRIVEGDSLEMTGSYLRYDGASKLAYFSGGVEMTHQDMLLITPSMTYDRAADYGFYTEGGIIYTNNKKDTLTSKKGYYYIKISEARFRDSVVLRSSSYRLFSDTLHYNSKTERSSFYGPTKILDGDQVILCERGWANSKEQLSEFSKNAVVYSDGSELRGDTIQFDQQKNIGVAYGNVLMVDSSENYYVKGQYGWHSKSDSLSVVTGEAEYVQIEDGDSLFLHGDSLFASYDSLRKRLIKVFNKVGFYRSDMQGRCDSLVMSDADSSIHMFVDPIIWSDENQIHGEYIRLRRKKGRIERMFIEENSFICSEVDSTKYNQIKGKNMEAFFEKNKLRKVKVFEQPKTIYYVEESDSSYLGLNSAQSEDQLIIYLDSNKVSELVFYGKPGGLTSPMKDVNESNSKLKGFLWNDSIRPKRREDIFLDPIPRSIQEEEN